jgi:glycine/D-amino acid oxidase-like deaminating enzyme
VAALKSKWFHWLPLKPLKGETLKVKISIGKERIFSRGVFLVPTLVEEVFAVGSTYVHPPFSEETTQAGREDMESKLKGLVRPSFQIVHQDWGIRPTTPDRRPMLGPHPKNKNVVIFNGLGTKGVSLAPYFAHQLAEWLEGKSDLGPEVNIYRFKALYSEFE